jgi:hypothetical protein
VYFTEPVDPSSVDSTTVRVLNPGVDGRFGTADDTVVAGALDYRETLNAVLFVPPNPLAPGNYRLAVSPPLRDLAGNPLAGVATADFRVFSFVDDDQDGLPDEIEASLGLDPKKADTNGNGIVDGLEDFDRDGLPNAGEIFAETDPKNPDTNANGILDGAEDPDGDALNNAREFIAGTNPLVADSDGDGWNDETEVTSGSDPLDPSSRPRLFLAGRPPVSATIISHAERGHFVAGTIVGRPPLVAHVLSLTAPSAVAPGSYVARPPVAVIRFVVAPDENLNRVIIGRPPVDVRLSQ